MKKLPLHIEIIDRTEQSVPESVIIKQDTAVQYVYLLNSADDLNKSHTFEVQDNAQLDVYYCVMTEADVTAQIHYKIGEHATVNHRVLFFASGEQKIDITETHQFMKPSGVGRFLAHGFLKDKAKSNYDSTIVIDPHAQKVDSRLDLHSFLLSRKAKSVMVPSLKIEAHDVKAGHGATVTHIDDETLFYLQSRGLTREQARTLYIDGIVHDFVAQFDAPEVQEVILQKINSFT